MRSLTVRKGTSWSPMAMPVALCAAQGLTSYRHQGPASLFQIANSRQTLKPEEDPGGP